MCSTLWCPDVLTQYVYQIESVVTEYTDIKISQEDEFVRIENDETKVTVRSNEIRTPQKNGTSLKYAYVCTGFVRTGYVRYMS